MISRKIMWEPLTQKEKNQWKNLSEGAKQKRLKEAIRVLKKFIKLEMKKTNLIFCLNPGKETIRIFNKIKKEKNQMACSAKKKPVVKKAKKK